MNINQITPYNNIMFKSQTFNERLNSRLNRMDWFEKNFDGGTTRAKDAVEQEMRNELEQNRKRAESYRSTLNGLTANYESESQNIKQNIASTEISIERERDFHAKQEDKISELHNEIDSTAYEVRTGNSDIKKASDKIIQKRLLSENLNNSANDIKIEIENIEREHEKKVSQEIERLKIKLQDRHNENINNLMNRPVLSLMQKVIAPHKLAQMGKETTLPNGILINTKYNIVSRLISYWITQKTNSNYLMLNANKYNNDISFFETLSNVSCRSRENYEKTGKHSYTLITNLEKFVNSKQNNLLPYLKSFLDTTAQDNHNTVILSSADSSNLDPILTAKHRFSVKMNIGQDFIMPQKYGAWSMLYDLLKQGTISLINKARTFISKLHKINI